MNTIDYETLRVAYQTRRYKSKLYQRLRLQVSGHGTVNTLVATAGPLPDTYCIQSYYDRNRIPDGEVFATVYPDNTAIVPLPNYMALQARYCFIALTRGRYVLERVRSVKHDTPWRVTPRVFWRPEATKHPETERWGFIQPDGMKVFGTYWDCKKAAQEFRVPVSQAVNLNLKTLEYSSAEPPLTRHWIPDARKEYVARRRKLLLHSIARAKMGAYDDAIKELAVWSDRGRQLRDQYSHVRMETQTVFPQLDADSNSTANALVESSLVRWHRWPVKDRADLERSVRQFVDQNAEKLRREMGAVVYS